MPWSVLSDLSAAGEFAAARTEGAQAPSPCLRICLSRAVCKVGVNRITRLFVNIWSTD